MTLTVTQQRIKRCHEDISNVLYGKEVADAFDCSDSNVCLIKKSGNGPIYEVVKLIRAIDNNAHFGNLHLAEAAIKEVVDIINTAGGFIAVQPVRHIDDVVDFLEGVERITEYFSVVIKRLKDSQNPNSENGTGISEAEMQSIDKAVRDLCRAALSINLWAARKQQYRS